MAIGLIAFCLVAIFGMLPVGLGQLRDAQQEAAAANALNQMANLIRNSSPNTTGDYVASSAYADATSGDSENIQWTLGGASLLSFNVSMGLSGQPSSSTDKHFVTHLDILPPSADCATPGRARISVAWPEFAVWSASSNSWTHAEGHVTSGIEFLPK